MSTEEERAAQYRIDQQAGENAMRARYKALAGSKSAYATRLAQTEALMHDEGWDPIARLTEAEKDTIN